MLSPGTVILRNRLLQPQQLAFPFPFSHPIMHLFLALLLCSLPLLAQAQLHVTDRPTDDRRQFTLVDDRVADIVYDANDEKLVAIAAGHLAADMEMVTGKQPRLITSVEGGRRPDDHHWHRGQQ